MGSYLDGAGLTQVWGKLKDKIDAAKEVKSLTKAEYDALEEKEQNVIYSVTDENDNVYNYIGIIPIPQVEVHHYVTLFSKSPLDFNDNAQTLYIDDRETNKFNIKNFSKNKIHIINACIRAITSKDNGISDFFFYDTLILYYDDDNNIAHENAPRVVSQNKVNVLGTIDNIKIYPEIAYKIYLYNTGELCISKHYTNGADWNASSKYDPYYIRNKPDLSNLFIDFSKDSYHNNIYNSSTGTSTIAIEKDSYIDIFDIIPNSETHTTGITSTILYIGRRNTGTGIIADADTESYCFSISAGYNQYAYNGINAGTPHISITQLSGSFTRIQKFTKLRVVFSQGKPWRIRLYYTNPEKTDFINVFSIGRGNCVKVSVPTYSEANNTYKDYDLNTGFKVWENTELKLDSNKNYTDTIALNREIYNNLGKSRDDKTFYVAVDYENTLANQIVGHTGDTFKLTFNNKTEFDVGDTLVVYNMPGYDEDGNIYGNLLFKCTTSEKVSWPYDFFGTVLNKHPEYSKVDVINASEEGMTVDIIYPVSEDITTTISSNSIASTTSRFTDDKHNKRKYTFNTNISCLNFKIGDVLIVPSMEEHYLGAKEQTGNLLFKVVQVGSGGITNYVNCYYMNGKTVDTDEDVLPTIPANTELKLYSRL